MVGLPQRTSNQEGREGDGRWRLNTTRRTRRRCEQRPQLIRTRRSCPELLDESEALLARAGAGGVFGGRGSSPTGRQVGGFAAVPHKGSVPGGDRRVVAGVLAGVDGDCPVDLGHRGRRLRAGPGCSRGPAGRSRRTRRPSRQGARAVSFGALRDLPTPPRGHWRGGGGSPMLSHHTETKGKAHQPRPMPGTGTCGQDQAWPPDRTAHIADGWHRSDRPVLEGAAHRRELGAWGDWISCSRTR